MRRLVYILLLMMVAGTVACQRTPGEAERQLIYIDSLIASAPDSALTLLAALSPSPNPQPAGTSEPSGTSGSSGASGSSETSGTSGESSPSKLEGARGSVSESVGARESSPSKLEGARGSVSESVGARVSSPSKLEGARGSVSASDEASPVPMTAGERAYHALLTAQAMYKAYIPATTDSVINVAWDYYSDLGMFASSTDRQRRVRALLYKGTTAEELGHPDSAMYWYKRTELEAAPDDHYHRGFALMSMGRLYQGNHEIREAINHYLNVLSEADTSMDAISLFCTQQLSQLYIEEDFDSAKLFINNISQYVKETNDSIYMLSNMVSKSMVWFYQEKYDSAKNIDISMIDIFQNKVPYSEWYHLVSSYSKLNMPDSAEYYYSIMPKPLSSEDTVLYYELLHLIHKGKKDWKTALEYEKLSSNLSDDILLNENKLLPIELQVMNEYELENNKSNRWLIATIILLAISLILMVAPKKRKYRDEKFAKEQIMWLNEQFINAQANISDLKSENIQLQHQINSLHEELIKCTNDVDRLRIMERDSDIMKYVNVQFNIAFQNCIQPLGRIANDYYEHGEDATSFISRFKMEFDACWKSRDFWTALENHINATRNNAVNRIKDAHPSLTISELRLIMLLMLHFDPMAIVICMGYKNTSVLYSMKNKLKRKISDKYKTLEDYLECFSGGTK